MRALRGIACQLLLVGGVALTGCGVANPPVTAPGGKLVNGIQGMVHGGNQPVVGSTIQLYTVGISADGSASTPLLTQTVQTDSNGNFTLTTLYSCTSATYVYLTATGGQPVPGTTNPNLAMMTALGPCSSLGPNTFIFMNEVTTVAAVYALAPYMTAFDAVGSSPAHVGGLEAAFALAQVYANSATGVSPGAGVASTQIVPTTLINTLADIVASCINSAGGSAGDSTLCGDLFTDTKPSAGNAATDTVGALLNLASNPTLSTSSLFGLIGSTPPFQPMLSAAPNDLHVALLPASPSGYVLQVGPGSIAFPDTTVASSATAQSVLLVNHGGTPLSVGPFTLGGTNASDFSVVNGCSATLAAGASCALMVAATPSATGVRSAYLSVASSSPDSPQYVTLSVNGLAAGGGTGKLAASASSVSVEGGFSQVITLSNVGSGALSLSSISTQTSYFLEANTCGSSLAAGATCTVLVTNQGGGVDVLLVASNDPASPYAIPLTGGTISGVDLSIPVFGPTAVGQSSSTVIDYDADFYRTTTDIGFEGVGNPVYQYTTLDTSISGPNASDFSISQYCSSLNANDDVCTLFLAFKPTAPGIRVAYLGSGSQVVPLYGVGTSGTPGNLSWDGHTLTNLGSSAVTISSIVAAPAFPVVTTCGSSLAGGASCTASNSGPGVLAVNTSVGSEYAASSSSSAPPAPPLDFGLGGSIGYSTTYAGDGSDAAIATISFYVGSSDWSGTFCSNARANCSGLLTFTPTSPGAKREAGTVSVTDSADTLYSAFTRSYTLWGTELGQTTTGPSLSRYEMASEGNTSVPVGTPTGLSYQFWNSGSTALNLSATLSGPNASEYSVTTNGCTAPTAINPCTVSYSLTPTAPGLRTATLMMTDSVSGQFWTFPLAYIAATPTAGPASVSPTSLTFPATALTVESSPLSVTVSTPGFDPVTTSISPSTEFFATKGTCVRGETPCLLNIVFHPVTGGSRAATLTITDTVTNATYTVPLSGSLAPAMAQVSTTTVTFPAIAVNTTSQVAVTLTNLGTPLFSLTGVPTGGTDGGEFYTTNGCGSSVAAGTSCTITVTFAPTSAGSKTATATVLGTTSAGLPITLNLYGSAF